MMRAKAVVSWSSGKDSAWALQVVRAAGDLEVVGLLTTVTDAYSRVSMHGVREALLERQAEEIGLPLTKIRIPAPCPNEVYERLMRAALLTFKEQGVTSVVFGDLFLADLKEYREARLVEVGMKGEFPLWLRDTASLAREMIAGGLQARLSCVDPKKLDRSFAGRTFDEELLRDLPAGVDPCGENGEFHSFAWAGPMFRHPIPIQVGEVVERDGFVFADLVPVKS